MSTMSDPLAARLKSPRLAVRAIIVHDDRLLLVNAYPGNQSDLWCAPGGGVVPHKGLPENLTREVYEETGLTITVGPPALVNEFDDPKRGFHQVDIYFRCSIPTGVLPDSWRDPEGVVNRRRFVTRQEISALRVKPDSLAAVAWSDSGGISYDPLERIVR